MILADSSAWIEYLRDTRSPTCEAVDGAIRSRQLAVCDPVRMEVLAGGRDHQHLRVLERLLATPVEVPTERGDYDHAAELYRTCRRRGETVRTLTDCLIGAIAIREDLPILHADADFDALARHTALRVVS